MQCEVHSNVNKCQNEVAVCWHLGLLPLLSLHPYLWGGGVQFLGVAKSCTTHFWAFSTIVLWGGCGMGTVWVCSTRGCHSFISNTSLRQVSGVKMAEASHHGIDKICPLSMHFNRPFFSNQQNYKIITEYSCQWIDKYFDNFFGKIY